jgi:ankyrin repeat protein
VSCSFKSHFEYTCYDWHTGEIELLRILLSKGVDVDSQSDAGTPLMWAAGLGQEDAVNVLLEHHASVSLHFFLVFVIFIFYLFSINVYVCDLPSYCALLVARAEEKEPLLGLSQGASHTN